MQPNLSFFILLLHNKMCISTAFFIMKCMHLYHIQDCIAIGKNKKLHIHKHTLNEPLNRRLIVLLFRYKCIHRNICKFLSYCAHDFKTIESCRSKGAVDLPNTGVETHPQRLSVANSPMTLQSPDPDLLRVYLA